MADKITKITREDNPDTSVKQWTISYDVEDGADKNSFCVTVKAEDMTDATSESEAKTAANTKASTIKSAWVTEKANDPVVGSETEPDEAVTL